MMTVRLVTSIAANHRFGSKNVDDFEKVVKPIWAGIGFAGGASHSIAYIVSTDLRTAHDEPELLTIMPKHVALAKP